jgi:nucleotide-binding universal stress UspA family protein
MATQHNILAPTDFSPNSDYALPYAIALAKSTGSTLHFVHVLAPTDPRSGARRSKPAPGNGSVREAVNEHAKARLQGLVEQALVHGVPAHWHLRDGLPVAEILRVGQENGCALTIVATHGHVGLGPALFGTTCERIIRRSRTPVLVVKHPEHEFVRRDSMTVDLKRVLCPVDFSEQSKQALPLAKAFCKQYGATLVVANVVERPYIDASENPDVTGSTLASLVELAEEQLTEIAADCGDVPTETHLLTGMVAKQLVRFIDRQHIDLVIMSTHGRTGLAHLLFGSVAERLLRSAPCPVLTVRLIASNGSANLAHVHSTESGVTHA